MNNPLFDTILHLSKSADYYNSVNTHIAQFFNEALINIYNSGTPLLKNAVLEMKQKGLIDKTGKITKLGKTYIAQPVAAPTVSQMSNFQVANLLADVLQEVNDRNVNPHEIIPEGSDAFHNWTEFSDKWSDSQTPFLENVFNYEDDIDNLNPDFVQEEMLVK